MSFPSLFADDVRVNYLFTTKSSWDNILHLISTFQKVMKNILILLEQLLGTERCLCCWKFLNFAEKLFSLFPSQTFVILLLINLFNNFLLFIHFFEAVDFSKLIICFFEWLNKFIFKLSNLHDGLLLKIYFWVEESCKSFHINSCTIVMLGIAQETFLCITKERNFIASRVDAHPWNWLSIFTSQTWGVLDQNFTYYRFSEGIAKVGFFLFHLIKMLAAFILDKNKMKKYSTFKIRLTKITCSEITFHQALLEINHI